MGLEATHHAQTLDRVDPARSTSNDDDLLLGVLLDGAGLGNDPPDFTLHLLLVGLDEDLAVSLRGSKGPERVEARSVLDIARADVEARAVPGADDPAIVRQHSLCR